MQIVMVKFSRSRGGGVQPKFFGNFEFELAVGPSGPTCGPTFPGVFEVPDPRRRRGATPKYGHRKWSDLKIAQNRDCGGSTDTSRSPQYQGTLFFEIG